MIADTIRGAASALAQMSYENWVSILLATLGVLLAIVTLIVAIAGIVIAIIGIWGIRTLKKAAEQRAHEAVQQAISGYPDAAAFIEVHKQMQELYRVMQQQISAFKQEFEVLHQRSEAANQILDRLSTEQRAAASNGNGDPADKVVGAISSTYPGEEVDPDDGSHGVSRTDKVADATDSR